MGAIRIVDNMLEILDLAEGSDKTLRANEPILETNPSPPLVTAFASVRAREMVTKD